MTQLHTIKRAIRDCNWLKQEFETFVEFMELSWTAVNSWLNDNTFYTKNKHEQCEFIIIKRVFSSRAKANQKQFNDGVIRIVITL